MRTVNVVAAIICDNTADKKKILATQRGYGEYKDGWEFPGGKIEEGETPEQALMREIKEELDIEIAVDNLIDVIDYEYPDFLLHMNCYWATMVNGTPQLLEHEAAKWLSKDTLYSVDWLPADKLILEKIERELEQYYNGNEDL